MSSTAQLSKEELMQRAQTSMETSLDALEWSILQKLASFDF